MSRQAHWRGTEFINFCWFLKIIKNNIKEKDYEKTTNKKFLTKFEDDLSWDSINFGAKRKGSLRKNNLPKLKIDELELYEPKIIKTMNEMIVECDELEENENKSKELQNFINKRQKVDGIISQLIGSDEIRSKSFNSLKILKSDRSIPQPVTKNVILENLDEYSSDEY